MPDYNVYIHAIGTGSDSSYNPTMPWSARNQNGGAGESQTTSQTSSGVNANGVINAIIKASGYASNPDSLVSKAITALGKAFPIAAAAYAVVQLADSVVTTATEFGEIETGDYRFGVHYQDVKAGINIILHPISSAVNSSKIQAQWRRENQKLRAQRDLLGDSIINSYTNRGV